MTIQNVIGSIAEFPSLDEAIKFAKNHHLQISKTWIIFESDSRDARGVPVKYIDTGKQIEIDL